VLEIILNQLNLIKLIQHVISIRKRDAVILRELIK